jgi:putative ABC transport system substrate-binding protein
MKPGIKRIYVPNAAQDSSSVQSLQSLTTAAKAQGVELVVANANTPEELDSVTKSIPPDVDALFVIRSGSLGAKIANIVQATKDRRIPSASSDIGTLVASGLLMGYGPGYSQMGEQLSRMADKVLKGADPGTLPIENAEAYLGINLQTAQAIGVEIPDSILRQATQIIRLPSDQTAPATADK